MTSKHDQKRAIQEALTTGPIPVPDAVLDDILALFITDSLEVLNFHAGYALEEKLRSIKTTLQLFNTANQDLLKQLDAFDSFSRTPEFHYRAHRDRHREIESRIRKEIFVYSALAHSLQDHCRRLLSDWAPDQARQQISACFGDDGLHDFICGLRTALHHRSMIEADWLIQDAGPNATSHYVFEKRQLQAMDDLWNQNACRYLEAADSRIDVRELINAYTIRVRRYYEWLVAACEENQPSSVIDYRRCLNRKFGQDARATWRFMLAQYSKRSINPYDFLERYLTPPEYQQAMSYPMRSPEQVDYIIQRLDQWDACDGDMRAQIWGFFGVSQAA